MINGLVSVVVPIYNVERYLERCISSIINQSYQNLEIILVDDGSPDRCPLLCDQWAQKDCRIKVIHKKNAGLGMARNTGIAHATGEYICFFDSDDYVDESTIEKTICLAQKESADIVIFGNTRLDKNGKSVKKNVPIADKVCYTGDEVRSIFLPDLIDSSIRQANIKNLCMNAWSCLYSMKLIREANWTFVSERQIISEDSFSLMGLYRHVNCVAILPDALYFYCENSSSLTQVYREDRYEKLKQYYFSALDLARQMGYCEEIYKRISSLFFSYSIGAMKQIVAADIELKRRIKLLAQIIDDEMMCEALRKIPYHYTSWAKEILCWALRCKMYHVVFLLVKLQNLRTR